MNISRDEAAKALAEVDAAAGQARRLVGYNYASPFFILWGAAWLIADLFTQFAPRLTLVWPITSLTCMALCGVIILVQSIRDRRVGRPSNWRAGLTAMFGGIFLGCLFLVLWPLHGKQVHSVFGLAYGAAYAVLGLWIGWRLVVLGVIAGALTLFAFYAVDQWYPLFMGVVVGGGMLLGGLWLRKV